MICCHTNGFVNLDSNPFVVDQLDSSVTKFEKEIDEMEHCNPGFFVLSIPTEKTRGSVKTRVNGSARMA